MQRTEPSVGRTSPKDTVGNRLNGVCGSTEECEQEDCELEDLAQAYGARLPASVTPPLYFQFPDRARHTDEVCG